MYRLIIIILIALGVYLFFLINDTLAADFTEKLDIEIMVPAVEYMEDGQVNTLTLGAGLLFSYPLSKSEKICISLPLLTGTNQGDNTETYVKTGLGLSFKLSDKKVPVLMTVELFYNSEDNEGNKIHRGLFGNGDKPHYGILIGYAWEF